MHSVQTKDRHQYRVSWYVDIFATRPLRRDGNMAGLEVQCSIVQCWYVGILSTTVSVLSMPSCYPPN